MRLNFGADVPPGTITCDMEYLNTLFRQYIYFDVVNGAASSFTMPNYAYGIVWTRVKSSP
jgi:hypothetical protein